MIHSKFQCQFTNTSDVMSKIPLSLQQMMMQPTRSPLLSVLVCLFANVSHPSANAQLRNVFFGTEGKGSEGIDQATFDPQSGRFAQA